ncbi:MULTISPECIES: efflux RND transporter periplasmic adaptor subunit [unclassified Sphingomonas]|jgi:cobalt-zinc-cadmium efflux system membrane fusion protein|uniref:efflux RND transporter periplasmic adaptor subunit n=1 Tax=unclassified Sphingomonas TaxID=196159 RepID=UPI00092A8548|nr:MULTISPECIES: efflux RND transporter periplasmic adaptor subunit [unclassified Sphingomonas]MBN8847305.1 efflux RND transporter periplasmic adaptor subunit [Sphingomonas sp.]OJV29224.1 MAG: efflux transporter periplasmic adaptor subunit [Sphingomonas sp. 67-36]
MIPQDKRLLGGVAGAVLLAAVGGFSVARCTSDPSAPGATGNASAPAEEAKAEAPSDTVVMTAERIKNAGVVTETVKSGGLGAEIVSQAIVTASPSGEAIVTARAGGAVTRIFKRLGDPVGAGEALAIVESRDAAQIAADRTAAAAKANLAQKGLAREQYLYKQKVSARVDLERAQAEAQAAAAEARRAQVAAGAANVTRDGRGVIVASPIAGRVTAENVSLGAFVQPETELFRVADPRLIQIEAAVGPADAQRLSAGDRAIVELPDGRTVDARVRAVTPTLSGETRAATAVLDVSGAALQPGLAVRVRLLPSRGDISSSIVVPEDAVQTVDGRDAVFVRTQQGFRARFVTLGQRSAGRVEIVSGLAAGQQIATKNAFLLKAELGKGAGEEE